MLVSMNTAAPIFDTAQLLNLRVSELLAQEDSVLDILLEYGFTPLKNPLTRAALAPTVTVGQALRLRGLSAVQQTRLLTDLKEALCH